MEAGPSGDDPALQVPLRVPRHRRSQTNLACPICGKTFGVDVIQAHADQCAAKQDRRSSDTASSRQAHRSSAPRKVVRGRSATSRRVAEPPGSWDIDMIDGFEFRSQARGAAPERQWVGAPDVHRRGGPPRPAASTLLAALPNGPHRAISELTAGRALPASANGTVRKFVRGSLGGPSCDGDVEENFSDDGGDVFFTQVREALREHPEKHARFTQAIVNFSDGRADAVELMQIVAPMLAGHGTLLAQFHKFLPEGYRIDRLPRALSGYIRCHIDPSGVTYNNAEHLASTFVDRMLEKFEGRPDVLNAVHAILSTTTLEDPSVPLVELDEPSSGAMKIYEALQRLLSDEEDLLREFQEYIPESCTNMKYVHTVLEEASD